MAGDALSELIDRHRCHALNHLLLLPLFATPLSLREGNYERNEQRRTSEDSSPKRKLEKRTKPFLHRGKQGMENNESQARSGQSSESPHKIHKHVYLPNQPPNISGNFPRPDLNWQNEANDLKLERKLDLSFCFLYTPKSTSQAGVLPIDPPALLKDSRIPPTMLRYQAMQIKGLPPGDISNQHPVTILVFIGNELTGRGREGEGHGGFVKHKLERTCKSFIRVMGTEIHLPTNRITIHVHFNKERTPHSTSFVLLIPAATRSLTSAINTTVDVDLLEGGGVFWMVEQIVHPECSDGWPSNHHLTVLPHTDSAARLVPAVPPPRLVPEDDEAREPEWDLRDARTASEGKSFAVRMRQHAPLRAGAAFPFFAAPKVSPSSSSSPFDTSSSRSSSPSPTAPPWTSSTTRPSSSPSSVAATAAFETEDTDSGDATPPSKPQAPCILPWRYSPCALAVAWGGRLLQTGDGTPFMQRDRRRETEGVLLIAPHEWVGPTAIGVVRRRVGKANSIVRGPAARHRQGGVSGRESQRVPCLGRGKQHSVADKKHQLTAAIKASYLKQCGQRSRRSSRCINLLW
ncbi:hypothetical protein MUK42_32560 [Musa troglodytarum]|uniref:Uncharacterized protein n=1 Tax=Musa troglodytarum TaxID=320322 RepID=A0A9E7I235_9LILI|nr:hypothetical protein MUK42_32560 [Musa troglodytarum]